MKVTRKLFSNTVMLLLVIAGVTFAQTTGKITGKVFDAETGEPLIGANVLLESTRMGAAASADGEFFIINVPPGEYTVRCNYIGYESIRMQSVRVSVNRTTNLDFRLNPTVVEGEVVTVEAQRIAVKKDQTSSVRNVSSEQIDILPVENINDVVNMQAGVVQGHFRGGRSGEVSHLIDGQQVTNALSGEGRSVNLETEAIEEVEVIKGTFNAEYGRAMSGVVNAITKEGSNSFHGSVSGSFANYLTSNTDIFVGLKDSELDRNEDYKMQISGPVIKDYLSFIVNYRYQDNKGHLNGYKLFDKNNYSFFNDPDPMNWYSEKTGDSSYVPMNRDIYRTLTTTLASRLTKNIKLKLLYNLNDNQSKNYSHYYKYNPDGRPTNYSKSQYYALSINHMLASSLFYELKMSYLDNYYGNYMYEDPLDSRYVHPRFSSSTGPGFSTGGDSKDHYESFTKDLNVKFDINWQINKNHSIKTGVDYLQHDLESIYHSIQNKWHNTEWEAFYFDPVVYPDSSLYSDIYHKKPLDFSAYIQDKMEFDEMVINIGVRYDYVDPNTQYPSNLRNPVNLIRYDDPSRMSTKLDAEPKAQISPRLGMSYQLGEAALLHFSYGHFFQSPPFSNFYQNNSWIINPTNFATQQGNPQLRPQRTVQYEIGLWQQLMKGMGLEVSLFYRDIYDLLSMAVITTYNAEIYGRYTNKDYGNAKGLEITYDFATGDYYANVNYTLQYTRGNADNALTTFDRAGQNQDPIPRLIPMSWDQRHTLNVTLGYHKNNMGATLTGYYNSNSPYTWAPLPSSQLYYVNLYQNNDWKPNRYNLDLYGYYDLTVMKNIKMRFSLNVYNLLDNLNENWVYSRTGRAYTNVVLESERNNHHSDFNTYEDTYQDPSAYSAPRLIKFGVGFMF
ncbi:MAG TPA: TonB-dependent receptor [bacterium]|nr:TonB-dependent receptor [bacterium]HPN43499.1 TonB-dependent receptor [bacterium]